MTGMFSPCTQSMLLLLYVFSLRCRNAYESAKPVVAKLPSSRVLFSVL